MNTLGPAHQTLPTGSILDPRLLRAFRAAWQGDLLTAERYARHAADYMESCGDVASAANLRNLLDVLTGTKPAVVVRPMSG